MPGLRFTKTQQKLYDILGDGLPHSKPELAKCLPDDLGVISNIQIHFSNMRKILNPVGQDIVTKHIQRRTHYMLVRLISKQY